MAKIFSSDVSIEIDGRIYKGQYTITGTSLTVSSIYGSESTFKSPASLQYNETIAQIVLQGIVENYLRQKKISKK
ncbi:hypothetical protein ACX27_02700 [Nostoc piscinale CENA21]|uniref:Uncharacterized protein n=1 Tax=Nostoc piscinale CENA21 TaxID=224013 RepID=A0A0M5MGM7_9NOSO|nr:hypothetical protein [Nostoc piscinale]ALF52005.1 hypothetical protein ACX27_02700 [Nostoc piscinale CENA21]